METPWWTTCTSTPGSLSDLTVGPSSPAGGALAAGWDESVGAQRERRRGVLRGRERLATPLVIYGFVVAAAGVLIAVPPSHVPVPAVLALVAAYAVISRVEFEVGDGIAVPTQLLLVPMLFTLPTSLVPACVGAGFVLGTLDRGSLKRGLRTLAPLASGWHALGPAIVLLVAGEHQARWSHWPLYLLALTAQLGVDFAVSAGHEWLARGSSPRSHLRSMGLVWLVDVCLSPVAVAVAIAVAGKPAIALVVVPFAGLITVFARERRGRLDHQIELSTAYRGTALLLGDVIEADDAYTGSHSRDVVGLSLAVADVLGVDAVTRRRVELAALLHDVGKIRIPGEIINKPGKLNAEEWEVMKTHATEGERLLKRVGGLLGDVGEIVRSHHEDWDGTGYPDGLAGNDIPLVARIISCCDAFNAMTTDRPYRKARPASEAMVEMRRCAGTQFDPRVVEALGLVVPPEL
jgi:putative nucleotidyltransferase with HDIG domain